MASKDVNRLQRDLPVLLPDAPGEADACVGRVVGDLTGRDGIGQVHVMPASGDQPAKICIHFYRKLLSLGRIREIAERAGARVTERFGHALWEANGLQDERRARSASQYLQRVQGVLETGAAAPGPPPTARARGGYCMGPGVLVDTMLKDGSNDAFSGQHSG